MMHKLPEGDEKELRLQNQKQTQNKIIMTGGQAAEFLIWKGANKSRSA